ncbi:putative cytoplasm protein [Calocera viscosa TUFC12733]|uniref:Gluconokinase n=1 Tax=Calocera viscosa (strain TUFC12733) TaxID=1330018 RepID=A0A167GMQ9_CALVF|nr:putative cytoplasm protein [Calocera viscosa TUFC12733]
MSQPLSVPESHPPPALIVVMGVSGSGKSTVGAGIAKAISRPFIDGDDLHPKSNVEKMSKGHPLTDQDRFPWLAIIRSTAERVCAEQAQSGEVNKGDRPAAVVVCSSLKKIYRDILRGQHPASTKMPPEDDTQERHPSGAHIPATAALKTYFIFLDGTEKVILDRMSARKGHFMKAGMLQSQLATLESPEGEEGVARVDIDATPDEVVAAARKAVKDMIGM